VSNSDRRNSQRARRICVETHARPDHLGRLYMFCHCGCRGIIYPKDGRTRWRADHNRRWADGGRDTPDNLFPILVACDAGVGGKASQDTKIIAHGRRVDAKANGWRSNRSRPLMGTVRSGWKRKMDGTVVRR
jgi:hypothetical protein